MGMEEAPGLDPNHPATVVVEKLLAEADGDIGAALWLAALAILGLSSSASYGLTRTIPYEKVMPAKPKPPVIDGGM